MALAAAAAVTGPGHAAGLWPAAGAGRPGQIRRVPQDRARSRAWPQQAAWPGHGRCKGVMGGWVPRAALLFADIYRTGLRGLFSRQPRKSAARKKARAQDAKTFLLPAEGRPLLSDAIDLACICDRPAMYPAGGGAAHGFD